MAFNNFPDPIRVVTGTVFDAPNTKMSSGEDLLLTEISPPGAYERAWTEAGTDTPDPVTNRIRYKVLHDPSNSPTNEIGVYLDGAANQGVRTSGGSIASTVDLTSATLKQVRMFPLFTPLRIYGQYPVRFRKDLGMRRAPPISR